MQSLCHPEQALFAQREPGLSEAEGDPGEQREGACPELAEGSRSLRRDNREFGSTFISPAPSVLPQALVAWQTWRPPPEHSASLHSPGS
jgi:hypothetical protein